MVIAISWLFLMTSVGFDQTAQKPAESDAVRQAIDYGNSQYIKFFGEKNAAGVAGVYDKYGSRLYPKGVVIRGQEAIKADLERFLGEVGAVEVTLKTSDVWVTDGLAYEMGNWSYSFKPKDQKEMTIGGRYVTVWKKQPDGGWKMFADMAIPND